MASVGEIVRPARYVRESRRSSPTLPILLRIPSYLPSIPVSVINNEPGRNIAPTVVPPARPAMRKLKNWLRTFCVIMLIVISLAPTAIINRRTLLPSVRDAMCWIGAVRESFTSGTGSVETRVKKIKARRTVKPAEPLPAPAVRLDAYVVPIDAGAIR